MHNRANAIEAMSSRGKGKFFFVLRTVGGAHCELGAMSCEACLRAAADKRVRLCKLYTAHTGLVKPRIQARETAEAKLEMYEYDPVLAGMTSGVRFNSHISKSHLEVRGAARTPPTPSILGT